MTWVRCTLAHTVHLVLEQGRLKRMAEDFPAAAPSDHAGIQEDLNGLRDAGVPTFLYRDRDGNPALTFCTPRYEIRCVPTANGDGYYVYRVSPLSLRSHNQIARCAVGVAPRRWVVHPTAPAMLRASAALRASASARSSFAQIHAAWERALQFAPPVSPVAEVTPAQASFLNTIETLVDLACDVELARAAARGLTPVVKVEPAATDDVYRMQIPGATPLGVGDFVRAGIGALSATHSGVVVGVAPHSLLVRFQRAEREQVRRVEWLAPSVSTKPYRIQKDALQALRAQRGLNPALLSLIVEGQFADYAAPAAPRPLANLNAAQQDMVARAQSAPDLLLALGPPGAGKTHTIRVIVQQQTALGGKVLITSKNNKAVDNVLEALEGVDALRIGREEAVSASVRPLMIDARASDLQAQVLANTASHFDALQTLEEAWPDIQQGLAALEHVGGAQRQAQENLRQAQQVLHEWQQARYRDAAPAIERQTQRFRAAEAWARRAWLAADALCRRMNVLASLCRLPLVGALITTEWDKLYARHQEQVVEHEAALAEMVVASRNAQQIWRAYFQRASADAMALDYKRSVSAAEQAYAQQADVVTQALAQARAVLARFADAPALPTTATPEALAAVSQRLDAWRQAAQSRRDLLQDWRALIEARPEALYPTLIQTADVVGATCIGVATDARFEDLAFDMVIADEAGQIQVMDLLVPLVRARRAVLVGDDRQLPPLVEDELVAQLDADDETRLAWLEQSLFEQLFRRESTPASRKVRLDTQYRMPGVIADFIAHHFYEDRYQTGRAVPHTDPFFAAPLVWVDTAQEPQRQERPALEAEGIRGYINECEARLLADLVLAYHDADVEWGVIVPYKKQAERIRQELRRRRSSLPAAWVQDWIATVDSFQGKERDVILYGFTRSNPRGYVGFLAELRRLNVSLTRARCQLVLVGDSATLTQAANAPFAELVQALLVTAQGLPGGYLDVPALRRCLKH